MPGRPDPLCPAARKTVSEVRALAGGCVALDADGTLWRGDVGEDFLRYLAAEDQLPRHRGSRGVYEEYERRVSRSPAEGYAFAVEVMADFEEAALSRVCGDFFRRRFLGRFFAFARPLVDELSAAGLEVWIVSASPRWVVAPGGQELGIPAERVIGVDCGIDRGRLTGQVFEPIPCGEGKVTLLEGRGRRPALAVGNGELDLPMLSYAERALVIAPYGEERNALVREAERRGWAIQRG
ncbi:MAG: haloacid dehalogenase-like hydrolase [Myxococcales bacterium]|nr:haloacid dehalogenase-like hydrolase [Myxococcales bacterium]